MKFIRADVKEGETKITEQIDALASAVKSRSLKAILNIPDSEPKRWADSILSIGIFPFSLLSGCKASDTFAGRGLIAGHQWQKKKANFFQNLPHPPLPPHPGHI